MSYLQLENLHRDFGTVKALNGINISLGEGEFLSLLGPSGSGKTTLLMMIAGFEMPSAGTIRIGNQDVTYVAPNRRNVFTTTADFTGLAFVTDARHLSPITSRLRIQTSARTDAEWDLDYDFKKGRINGSTTFVNYHFGQFTVGGGDAFLLVPGGLTSTTPAQQDFHQFRVLLGYGHPNKRGFSAASSFGFDANVGFLQYSTVQTTYNWDCCGVSLEYRRFALGSVRNENQFRFVFSLANIAAFGNLRRQERLF